MATAGPVTEIGQTTTIDRAGPIALTETKETTEQTRWTGMTGKTDKTDWIEGQTEATDKASTETTTATTTIATIARPMPAEPILITTTTTAGSGTALRATETTPSKDWRTGTTTATATTTTQEAARQQILMPRPWDLPQAVRVRTADAGGLRCMTRIREANTVLRKLNTGKIRDTTVLMAQLQTTRATNAESMTGTRQKGRDTL